MICVPDPPPGRGAGREEKRERKGSHPSSPGPSVLLKYLAKSGALTQKSWFFFKGIVSLFVLLLYLFFFFICSSFLFVLLFYLLYLCPSYKFSQSSRKTVFAHRLVIVKRYLYKYAGL